MRGSVADKVEALLRRSETREGVIREIDSVDKKLRTIEEFFQSL